jgi:hypothetical protein
MSLQLGIRFLTCLVHPHLMYACLDTCMRGAQVKSAIPHPLIMGVIHECGGKMHMQERDWESGMRDLYVLSRPVPYMLECMPKERVWKAWRQAHV